LRKSSGERLATTNENFGENKETLLLCSNYVLLHLQFPCDEHERQEGSRPPDTHEVYHASPASTYQLSSNGEDITAVLDIGVTRSVLGLRAARHIMRAAGQKLSFTFSNRFFRFGVQSHRCIGYIHINIRTPSGVFKILADVIQADIPLLIGLKTLDANRLQVLTLEIKLQHVPPMGFRATPWFCPLLRRGGHIHLPFKPLADAHCVHYSKHQLTKLHRQMYHPSAENLYQVLRRANPDHFPGDNRAVISEIRAACNACQILSRAPLTFQISLPGEVKFNREIRLDLMFLGKQEPVLHVVDSGTKFNADTFLNGESSAEIWNALFLCWSRVYCGDPQEISTDSGTAFCSEEFHNLFEYHDIIIRCTPIEQHNALGQGEQFHSSLRRTFNKVSLEYPNVPREVLLQLVVYALNTSANSHGLVPCLLVFGTLPRLPVVSETDPVSNNDRFKSLATAREEYERHIAEQLVACGLKTKVPSATDVIY
jgi:hypothetical protein